MFGTTGGTLTHGAEENQSLGIARVSWLRQLTSPRKCQNKRLRRLRYLSQRSATPCYFIVARALKDGVACSSAPPRSDRLQPRSADRQFQVCKLIDAGQALGPSTSEAPAVASHGPEKPRPAASGVPDRSRPRRSRLPKRLLQLPERTTYPVFGPT